MAEFKYRKKRKEFKEQARVRNNDYREIALTKMGKRQLMLTLLSIFGVTLLSIGSTFAMFTVSSKSAEYNVVKSGTLNISFDADSSSTIGLDGALPMSDSDGLAQTGNTFTIKNTGSLPVNYTVSLQDDTDMITQDKCSDKQLDKGFIKYNIDGTDVKLLSNAVNTNIMSGNLKAGESKTFTLKLWIKEDATNDALGKHYHGKIVVNGVQENTYLTTTLLSKANNASVDYYRDGTIEEMYTFEHESTGQLSDWSSSETTDYRYIGEFPNNFIKFNNELWRIIGVFTVDNGNGVKEKRVKIIRNESIGAYMYTYANEINSQLKNQLWDYSPLMRLMNPGYENDTVQKNLYWTRGKGTCSYLSNSTNDCDFSTIGLTDDAKKYIAPAVWYSASLAKGNESTTLTLGAENTYNLERGNIPASASDSKLSWTGTIGLMYLSDYLYSYGKNLEAGLGIDESKACYFNSYACDHTNDGEISWFLGKYLFKMTSANYVGIHAFNYSAQDGMFFRPLIYQSGQVIPQMIVVTQQMELETLPTAYLKSDVLYKSGTGTESDPYIICLN